MFFKNILRFGVLVFFVSAILPFLLLSRPLCRLRFGTMYTQRFGQLAINADIFLRNFQLSTFPSRTFYFFFGWNPVNRQLMEMWKRQKNYPVRFIESRIGTKIMFVLRNLLQSTGFWESAKDTALEYYLYNNSKPVLSFTQEEEQKGKAFLQKMGISETDWFVCFHARDDNYFQTWSPELKKIWKKTSFRSISIENYSKAAEYIASQGGYAIRYGANAGKPFNTTENAKILDYSSNYRDDFMDIYLVAKCRFFLGCCSGPLALATAFNTPTISVNHLPYNYGYYKTNNFDNDIFVQRLIVNPKNKTEIVPFWKAKKKGYFSREKGEPLSQFDNMFDTLETESDDILDACKDMIEALNGITISDEAKKIQNIYAETYLSCIEEYKYSAKIGPRFGLKYRDLIIPPIETR